MKIKLINGTIYAVSRAEVTNGRLEIDFRDKPAEEIQNIFTIPGNLTNIELLTDENEKFGDLPGWTVYSGVFLKGDIKTAILTKEIDSIQNQLANIQAKALEANALAESTASQVTDLQMALCEIYEGMGV